MKGQSAIEYLMTYGWMLLVVAIVGGAIFAVVGNQVVESTSGFTGQDIQVENFGATSEDNLEIILRNAAGSSIEIKEINVSDDQGRYTELLAEKQIGLGSSESVTLGNVEGASSGNTLDVQIIYDTGVLENLAVSGTISGGFELTEDSTTLGDSLEVDSFERTDFDDGSYTYTGNDNINNFETIEDNSIESTVSAVDGNNLLRMFNMQDADRVYSNPGDGRSNYPKTGDTFKVWFATNDTGAPDNRIRVNYNWLDDDNYNDVRINFDSQEVYLFEVGGNSQRDYKDNIGFETDRRYLLEVRMNEGSHTAKIYDSSGSEITELNSNTNPHSDHSGIGLRSWRLTGGTAQYFLGSQVDNTVN